MQPTTHLLYSSVTKGWHCQLVQSFCQTPRLNLGSEAAKDRTGQDKHRPSCQEPYPWEEGEVAGSVAVAANDLNYCSINKVVLRCSKW